MGKNENHFLPLKHVRGVGCLYDIDGISAALM